MAAFEMDLSILPGYFSNQNKKMCIPGEKIYCTKEENGLYKAGNGCYESKGYIYASLLGFVYVFTKTDYVNFFHSKNTLY